MATRIAKTDAKAGTILTPSGWLKEIAAASVRCTDERTTVAMR